LGQLAPKRFDFGPTPTLARHENPGRNNPTDWWRRVETPQTVTSGAGPVKWVLWLVNRELVTLLFTFFSSGKWRSELPICVAGRSFRTSLVTPPMPDRLASHRVTSTWKAEAFAGQYSRYAEQWGFAMKPSLELMPRGPGWGADVGHDSPEQSLRQRHYVNNRV
jgi:hypothetical protein